MVSDFWFYGFWALLTLGLTVFARNVGFVQGVKFEEEHEENLKAIHQKSIDDLSAIHEDFVSKLKAMHAEHCQKLTTMHDEGMEELSQMWQAKYTKVCLEYQGVIAKLQAQLRSN